jgi:hypothetical protein
MGKRKPKTSKRRIPIRAVALYQKLKAIEAAGMAYVNEPIGNKREFLRGRYELCDLLGLREPWQSFPLECNEPNLYADDDLSYRAECHRIGWAARKALEDASR